ncbi:MAG: hypothetical protein GX977_07225 [Firmicutes bacterium]|nr:hypothetical protein [Bacillota bacterium]
MTFLGLDLGTTGCKATIFSETGEIRSYAYKEYPVSSPRPGWAEQDPIIVWDTTREVLRKVSQSRTIAEPISALSISTQGEAVMPVDENGNPLRDCILGMDMRAIDEAIWLNETIGGDRLFALTGVHPHPITTLAKILWIKRNEPSVFHRAVRFLLYEEYIFNKLGGVYATDTTTAARTMMFDINKCCWSDEILEAVDLDSSRLATVFSPGQPVGTILPEVADELCLNHGIVLVAGGHDVECATLGAGGNVPGVVVNVHGTADILASAIKPFSIGKDLAEKGFCRHPHVVEGMHMAQSLNQSGGLFLQWFRDNFRDETRQTGKGFYDEMMDRLPNAPASVMVLPHLVGSVTPWPDPRSRAAILGLTLHASKEEIFHGIVDSVAYDLRNNLEIMEKGGVQCDEVRMVGGGAKSEYWIQLKATVLKSPIYTLRIREASCLGAAILAAVGFGAYKCTADFVKEAVSVDREFLPDRDLYREYDRRYKIYRELYGSVTPIHHRLAAL